MNETSVAPQQEILQKPVGASFSKTILNFWAESNDHTTFRYQQTDEKDITARVNKIDKEGHATVTLPENPTLQDILCASTLVREKGDKKSSPLDVFTKRLKDSAILISQNAAFAGEDNNEVIETLYNIGNNLEQYNAKPIVLTHKEIQAQKVIPPQDADPKKYEDSIFLFLLGKNAVLSGQVADIKLTVDPQHSFYSALYSKWRDRQNVTLDNEQIREGFDGWLLKRKDKLAFLLQEYAEDSLTNGRGKMALNESVDQAVIGELESAIAERGRKIIRDNLKNPPQLEDIDPELQQKLLTIFGNSETFKASNLFQTAEKILEVLQLEKKEEFKTIDKVKALWELVQAYKFDIIYAPSKVVETQKFECTLRSYVLGELMRKYLKQEVVVFGDDGQVEHSRLLVAEKNTLNTENPLMYFIDPTTERSYRYQKDKKRIKQVNTKPIQIVEDATFKKHVAKAYQSNPDDFHLNLPINIADSTNTFLSLQSISSFNQSMAAAIWNNIAHLTSSSEERFQCYKKAIQLAPETGEFWRNLGVRTPNRDEKKEYFKKAVQLNPDLYIVSMELAEMASSPEERLHYISLAFKHAQKFSDNKLTAGVWIDGVFFSRSWREAIECLFYAAKSPVEIHLGRLKIRFTHA